MIAIPLLALLLIGAPQDSTSSAPASKTAPRPPQAAKSAPRFTPEQEVQIKQKEEAFKLSREAAIQDAVRINELAANIHSEADARKLVDAVAEEVTHHRHLFWAGQKHRHRVARAEFMAVSDPAGLISEERIVEVWNDYVREIGAPEEALITVAELHHFRGLDFHFSQHNWELSATRSIWSMPNIYAIDTSGGLAEGCRALEGLKIINNLHEQFARVHFAREPVQTGIANSDSAQKRPGAPAIGRGRVVASSHLGVSAPVYADPIRPAVLRYQKDYGQPAYDQLIRRLFDELFPAE